jgi:hypothetical protein
MESPVLPVTAGTVLPSAAGQAIEIQGGMHLLRAPVAGDYSFAWSAKPDGAVRLMLDDLQVDNVAKVGLTAGLHSIFVLMDGKLNAAAVAGAKIKVALEATQ